METDKDGVLKTGFSWGDEDTGVEAYRQRSPGWSRMLHDGGLEAELPTRCLYLN